MFRKLKAIWRILTSDRYAVFYYKGADEDPVWLTAPTFGWVIHDSDDTLLFLIQQKLKHLFQGNRQTVQGNEAADS